MTTILGPRDRAVYDWEAKWVHPHASKRYDEATARAIVPHVWRELGLSNPPAVKIDRRWGLGGAANRAEINLGPESVLSVILHELAHSMDISLEASVGFAQLSTEGSGSYHDDNWLGLYVELLERFIGGRHFNKLWLYKTIHDHGLTVSFAPKPRCI